MTTLRLAIVGFGKIARDQHVPAIAADRRRRARCGGQPECIASRCAAFHVPGGPAARGTACRRRRSVHAAAGARRPGCDGACGRQARPARKAAGRERRRTRSADRIGVARRTDLVRDLALALRAGGRTGTPAARLAPRHCGPHHLEGGRARLASGAKLDLGAGRHGGLRPGHQCVVDPDPHPAAAPVL